MKSRVYVETTIVSYLTSRVSRDLVVAAHQRITRQWWEECAPSHELYISELVQQEVARGDASAAAARVAAIEELPILGITTEAIDLAESLVAEGPVPSEAAVDALHVGVAAANGMDYLLTWNCRHLANAALRTRFQVSLELAGYGCPVICTPEELMED